jgi:hypothetical protein
MANAEGVEKPLFTFRKEFVLLAVLERVVG